VPTRLRPLHQRTFRTDRRTRDQGDVVSARVLTLAGDERVLLRSTDDQARDDVDDAHELYARRRDRRGPGAEAPSLAMNLPVLVIVMTAAPFLRWSGM